MSVLSEFKGNVNLSSDTGTSTTVGTTLKVNTVEGKAVGDTLAIGNNLTTGTITIGTALNGSTTTNGLLTIGSTTATSVTTTAKQIKQVVPLLYGGNCQVITGNADNATSVSTTFNKIQGSFLGPIGCFTLTIPGNYCAGYFEILVSGTNFSRAGYAYKGCFTIDVDVSPSINISPVSTLFAARDRVPIIDFTQSGTVITLRVDTSTGNASTNQNFIATLIAYPTIIEQNAANPLLDFAVTAI
jgi:hypothetical protein